MTSTFKKVYYDIAYFIALVLYCIILPIFIILAAVLYGVFRLYDNVMRIINGKVN